MQHMYTLAKADTLYTMCMVELTVCNMSADTAYSLSLYSTYWVFH